MKKRLYKNKFFIVFYDESDEVLVEMFDNVHDILKYQNKELTRKNINLVNVELYRALKSDTHLTRFLNGKLLRVYIVDENDDDDINILT